MVTISAFADEIDSDPTVQMDVLDRAGVKHLDLRGAWGANVMDLSDAQCEQLRSMIADRGFGVPCIGSPIGKVTIDSDLDAHFRRFLHACDLAEFFGAGHIRVFSFYPPKGGSIDAHRTTVIERLTQMVEHVRNKPIRLVLENESDLYMRHPDGCADVLEALGAPNEDVVMAYDSGNFVAEGDLPVYEKAWEPLKRFVGYVHIKDRFPDGGPHVMAGEGKGDWPRILGDLAERGYKGVLTLEPHLSLAGRMKGSTKPDLFLQAAEALKGLCQKAGLSFR